MLLLLVILSLSPVVLNEYVTGGDLLANSIYVLLFVMWMVRLVPQDSVSGWKKCLSALALGIGLASRAHFVLLLPHVFSALIRRAGLGAATRYITITIVTLGLATVPFYLYDRAGFSPLHTAEWLQFESIIVTMVLPIAFVVVAIACAMHRANSDLPALLRLCVLVLAFPITSVMLFASIDRGAV